MDWVDLSQPLWEGADRAGKTRPPRFTTLMDVERDNFGMMEYTFISHIGTHLDAPSHFVKGGEPIDALSLDRVIGRGVVLDASDAAGGGVMADVLSDGGPAPSPGDIVLIRTGWEEKAGSPEYFHHPFLTESALTWLIDRQVKLVGVDLITPEAPESGRTPGFDWPVHHALLERGILIIENLCNMKALLRERVDVIAAPIKIKGGDGAPVRVLARRLSPPST